METLLSPMTRFINSMTQKETGVGRTEAVTSSQSTVLFLEVRG